MERLKRKDMNAETDAASDVESAESEHIDSDDDSSQSNEIQAL